MKRFRIEMLAGIILLMLGIFGFLFWGEKVTLDCQRSENACQLETFHLWGTQTRLISLKDLQGAKIEQTQKKKKQKITYLYRVNLSTTKGTVPFTDAYSSKTEQHYEIAHQINQFLKSPQQKSLNVQLDHLWIGYLFGVLFGIPGLIVLILTR